MPMQWSPALCRKEKCVKKPISKFTIHGMWASNKTDPQPMVCMKNVTKVRDLYMGMISKPTQTELHTSWPNFQGPDDFFFWQKQWYKHGTCSYSTFNQTQFFDVANDIWKGLQLFDILRAASISPSISRYQQRADFERAIRNHVGVPNLMIELDCPSPSNELLEIRMCRNHAGNAYIDCHHNGTCGLTSFKWKP
ncbi:hypothetical protein TSUD_254850 [Trifolium subterraneum]|uniref:Uncharacterized protein n=1 Tax=Trifolium subterraneum TaxID=3900 RepID=A0A2Z6P4J9_TRISU|nr:hypothetical protein TSUD_254850 [Trifolium subterraneum]